MANQIRVGIGGWTYEAWRNDFYPKGLSQARELEYASRKLTAIEVNGTYYSTQKPATFAKWRDETPDDFMFSLKASRYSTNRKVLAEAGESIERFVGSGVSELGPKLGPIVWQFMTTKRFEPDDFAAFLELLPKKVDGVALRHVMDVRHPTFMTQEYLALARKHEVATVFADSDEYPSFADLTGGFVYARLMKTEASQPEGYADAELDRWAERARTWANGGTPGDLPKVATPVASPVTAAKPRDVFMFFISGAKEKAPHAAMGLIRRLAGQ